MHNIVLCCCAASPPSMLPGIKLSRCVCFCLISLLFVINSCYPPPSFDSGSGRLLLRGSALVSLFHKGPFRTAPCPFLSARSLLSLSLSLSLFPRALSPAPYLVLSHTCTLCVFLIFRCSRRPALRTDRITGSPSRWSEYWRIRFRQFGQCHSELHLVRLS